jgi:hypothetical protein
MAKFPQRVTFVAVLEVDTEGMNWQGAETLIAQALLDGDGGDVDYTLTLVKATRMEVIEED